MPVFLSFLPDLVKVLNLAAQAVELDGASGVTRWACVLKRIFCFDVVVGQRVVICECHFSKNECLLAWFGTAIVMDHFL